MASSRLRCPGCKTPIEVIHETAPSIITCSQCGKRLRIGDKPSTGDAPASSPRPKTSRPVSPAQDPGEVLSEFSEFESTDESDESSEEQSWTDGYEDSWNDSEQEEWSSDEEETARPLPPRTTRGATVSGQVMQENQPRGNPRPRVAAWTHLLRALMPDGVISLRVARH